MSTAIPQHHFRFPEGPDEEHPFTEACRYASILVFDTGDTGDATATAIISAWARHGTATNGFGD